MPDVTKVVAGLIVTKVFLVVTNWRMAGISKIKPNTIKEIPIMVEVEVVKKELLIGKNFCNKKEMRKMPA